MKKQKVERILNLRIRFMDPYGDCNLLGSPPLMSLIDTAVIGQEVTLSLLLWVGPGLVLCDYMSFVFIFLSIATSNVVATSLAGQGKEEMQHQISMLLFVGLACGFSMLLLTRGFGSWALTAFAGPKNVDIVPAANKYLQSWHERFLGTFEGFGDCCCCKRHW